MPLWLNASTRRLGSKNIRPQSLLGRLDLIRRTKAAMPSQLVDVKHLRAFVRRPNPGVWSASTKINCNCGFVSQVNGRLERDSLQRLQYSTNSPRAVQYCPHASGYEQKIDLPRKDRLAIPGDLGVVFVGLQGVGRIHRTLLSLRQACHRGT